MMSKRRRSFSPEFKFQVAMDCLTGQKRRVDLVREHQLSDSTLERWCQKVLEGGSRVFASSDQSILAEKERQIAELERVIGRLTVELEAAKKVSSWHRSR
jgi:transposase-like protein